MLCYSTLGLPDWPIEDWCVLLKRFGFDGVEIALTPEHIKRRGDRAFWSECKRSADACGVKFTVLHLGNPRLNPHLGEPTLINADEKRRQYWINLTKAAFDIARELNCEYVAVASGPADDAPAGGADRETQWRRLVESLEAALEFAPSGCKLLLEHEPEHFIRTSDEMIELNERTGGRVLVNLDVGHLEVNPEPIGESIEKLNGLIKNVHVEDIKDHVHKHLLPGEGDIDFDEVARALRKIGYQGLITADLYPFADRPVVALARAREAFAKLCS